MDAFNILAGLVGIGSLLFSLWVYADGKRKEAVELEKAAAFTQRLEDMLNVVNAIARTAALMATLSDREETTKKELKHLVMSQLAMIGAAQDGLTRIHAKERAWRFGAAERYLGGAEEPLVISSEASPTPS
jgi:hypothetical protein